VMGAQLSYIASAMDLPNVVIQIVSYNIGAHPALDSVFTILELPGAVSNVVYVEGLLGQVYLEREQDTQRYGRVFDRLRDIALSPMESQKFIAEMARKYGLTSAA
jgi:hypothetical protein